MPESSCYTSWKIFQFTRIRMPRIFICQSRAEQNNLNSMKRGSILNHIFVVYRLHKLTTSYGQESFYIISYNLRCRPCDNSGKTNRASILLIQSCTSMRVGEIIVKRKDAIGIIMLTNKVQYVYTYYIFFFSNIR